MSVLNPFQRIIDALGDLCLTWSNIDGVVHDIVLHLSTVLNPAFEPYGPPEPKPWDLLHVALTNMDERGHIATAKAYAHYTAEWIATFSKADAATFYDRAEQLLNYVDNVLRPERNRFIHDYWELGDDLSVVRTKMGTQVRRPQSHQREVHLYTSRVYANVEEVEAFVTNLHLAYEDLAQLDGCISWLTGQREQPEPRPLQLPKEWLSLAHRDWRGAGKPSPPPSPSQG